MNAPKPNEPSKGTSLLNVSEPWIVELLKEEQLPSSFSTTITQFLIPLAAAIASKKKQQPQALIVGINGAQGTGKSTLALFLKTILKKSHGLSTAVLSIDDLYLSQEDRNQLATHIHPLLKTRGVPGTHATKEGLALLQQLRKGLPVTLPRFDKATDNPKPQCEWETTPPECDIVLFEGWCIGAKPQTNDALLEAINTLEAEEDREGIWRRYANEQLRESYAALFAEIDTLIHLQAPSFDCIYSWRKEQERKLAARSSKEAAGLMDDQALEHFIMHYERLTRWMLEDLPARSDYTLRLNPEHRLTGVEGI